MRKFSLFLILLMIISCVIMATNFYWYRTSNAGEGLPVDVFVPGQDDIVLIAVGGDYNAFGSETDTNIFTSTDGIKWVQRPGIGYNIFYLTSISGNSNGYVVGGYNGQDEKYKEDFEDENPPGAIVSSASATQWESNIISGSAILDIEWDPNKKIYIAVGDYGAEGIRTSEDGINWNNYSTNATLYGVSSGNGKIIAVGEWGDGGYYISTNGITWNKGNNQTGNNFYGIDYGNGKFVAVGDGQIYYITSSDEFKKSTGNFSAYKFYSVKWNGEIFVAVGEDDYTWSNPGIIYTSSDGVTWEKVAQSFSKGLKDITWSDELDAFFAVGDKVVVKGVKLENGTWNWNEVDTVDSSNNPLKMDLLEAIYAQPLPEEILPSELIILALADTSHALEISGHLYNNGGGIGAYSTKAHGVNISSYTHYNSNSGKWEYDFLSSDILIPPEVVKESVLNVSLGFLPFDKSKVRDFVSGQDYPFTYYYTNYISKNEYPFIYFYDEKKPTLDFTLLNKTKFDDTDPTGEYGSLKIDTEQNIVIEDDDIVILVDNFELNGRLNITKNGTEDTDLFIFVNNELKINSGADIISNDGSIEHVYIIHNGDYPLNIQGSIAENASINLDVFLIKKENQIEINGNANIGYIFMQNSGLKSSSLADLSIREYVYTEYGKIDFAGYSGLYNIGKGILTGLNDGNSDNAIVFGTTGGSTEKKILQGDGSFIYAPYGNAHFKTTANATYTGSIIADTIKIEANSFEVSPPAETTFPDPDIPQPTPPGYYDGDWLTNLDVKPNNINFYYPVPNIYGKQHHSIPFDSNDDINMRITSKEITNQSSNEDLQINVFINDHQLGPWELRETKNKKIQTQDILNLFYSAPNAAPHDLKAVNIHNLPQGYTGKIEITYEYTNKKNEIDSKDPQFNPIYFKVLEEEQKSSGKENKPRIIWEDGKYLSVN